MNSHHGTWSAMTEVHVKCDKKPFNKISIGQLVVLQMLQGDAYTGNWLGAIRHTPKLARKLIVLNVYMRDAHHAVSKLVGCLTDAC